MEYVPIASLPGGKVPTMEKLLETAATFGVDRLCVVNTPKAGEPIQLFIMLLGKKAVREIGPGMNVLFKEHPNPEGSEAHRFCMDHNSAISLAQDWMRERKQVWRYGDVAPTGHHIFISLCGNEICRLAAKILNDNVCACNLKEPPA